LFIPLQSARKNMRSRYSFGAALTLLSINLLFALALTTAEMLVSASADCAFILSIFACS
jgi:hypothetical protein